MKFLLLLTLTAVIAIAFGSGFILVPQVIWPIYGVSLDSTSLYLAQLFGTGNVAIGLIIAFTRNTGPAAEHGLATGILLWCLIEGAVLLLGQLSNVTNGLGWMFITFDALL